MSERNIDTGNLIENRRSGDGTSPVATGKPYSWQLSEPERPEMVALPPQIVIERTFAKAREFQALLERTAAFFVVVSRNNAYEGRDPLVVTDDLRCGVVSSFLGVDIDAMGRALRELERRGWVSTDAEGRLHLDDLAALDQLSEGGLSA